MRGPSSCVTKILRPRPHALADVVPRDHEILPVVGAAAQDDVDVRVVRVPVIDPDPVELGAEVFLGLAHQVAREALQVGHLGSIFGRDDEPEMMPVVLAALAELLYVGIVGLADRTCAPSRRRASRPRGADN